MASHTALSPAYFSKHESYVGSWAAGSLPIAGRGIKKAPALRGAKSVFPQRSYHQVAGTGRMIDHAAMRVPVPGKSAHSSWCRDHGGQGDRGQLNSLPETCLNKPGQTRHHSA
jgi:hypothetical protein